jgi:photosystem II stability/assembly factor-like uncharacterized protein
MNHWPKIITLLIVLGLFAGIGCTSKDTPSSFALPSDVPVAVSTSMPTPTDSFSVPVTTSISMPTPPPTTSPASTNNPTFEKIVNLGVPAGNGAIPWKLALNSQARLVYILTEGLPILRQGNGISVYDIEAGEITAHVKINQGSPTPLDLQFDPQASSLYVLWQEGFGDVSPTLSVIDSELLHVVQEISGIETFAAAGSLLYTVGQDKLKVWAVEADTLTERNQASLMPADTMGPMAVNPITQRLYLTRADDNIWTMEIFEADTLTPLDPYSATGSILDILPNPATGEIFVVEGQGDLRVLYRLTADGQPVAPPYELGPRFTASGIALSPDGQRLYFSNGELHPIDPQPGDETGPAFIGLTISDMSLSHKIPLLTNFDDVVFDAQTKQAFAIYPYDDLLYLINLDDDAVQIVNTAIEIRDVSVDAETGLLFVSDSANRLRRLEAETFAVLSETRLEPYPNKYGFQVGSGSGELALDRGRNRLYVSGEPAYVFATDTLNRIATLDPGGQFAPDLNGDKVYLSNCGVTILEADTLTGDTLLPGSGPRDDQLVPNPCVSYSQLDTLNQLLYSVVPNGTPGSNSGNYLYVYDLAAKPGLIFTDTNISIAQALPDPTQRRAFIGHIRHTNRRLRTLSVPSDGLIDYTHQLIGIGGKTLYSPQTNHLYLSDFHRLLTLEAATLNIIGEMPLPPHYDYQLVALDPAHERLYLAGYDGQLLMAKGDGGASRQENLAALQATKVLSLTERAPVGAILALESTANNHLLARISTYEDSNEEARLFLSTDEGVTWSDLSKSLPSFPVQALAVSPHYPDDQTLFVALTRFGSTGGLYKSTNGGQTWAATMRGLQDLWTSQLFISPNFDDTSSKKTETNLPTSQPSHPQFIFVDTTHAGLHYSADRGQNWTPLVQLAPHDLWPTAGSGAVAIGSHGVVLASQALAEMHGLFRATVEPDGDLSDWQQVLDIPLTLLAFAPDGNTAFGFGSGLWRSSDSGLTWQPGGAGLTDLDRFQATRFLFSPNFADDQAVYLFFTDIRSEDSGRLFRSINAGQTWQPSSGPPWTGPPWTGPPDDKRITAVTLTTDGDFLFGDDETQITRVSPAALRWVESESPAALFAVDDLAVSPNYAQDQTLFVISHQHGLFKSTNGGRTWQRTDFPVRSTSFEGYRLAISPAYHQDQAIYVVTGFSLHRSSDGGQTWQNLPPQGLNLQAQAMTLSPNFAADHTLLVSTPTAIFRSTDRGDTWQQVLARPEEAGQARVLTFAPSSEMVYAWFDYHSTLYVSDDSGQSWRARPGRPDDYFAVATAAAAPDGNLTIAPDFPPQLLQVIDQGQSWRVLADALPEGLSKVQTMAYTLDGTLLVGGQGGLFESTDNGQSWQTLYSGLHLDVNMTLVRLIDTYRFIVLREGIIFVSADGGSVWQDISVVK